jgi:NTP pyrophosphatase (non-canonical NTP hydrolase)
VNLPDIFNSIRAERISQELLRAKGKFSHTLATEPSMSNSYAVTVLTEELGEIARAVQDRNEANLREELIQLASCCVAWLERL